jgi:hypothetical protein
MTETRYQRVAREQRERQEARAKRRADEQRIARQTRYRRSRFLEQEAALKATADRVDGYDRDDLGPSADF